MNARPLLVGEQDPYSDDPAYALWVQPFGCAGARLARILGLTFKQYLDGYDRVNLLSRAVPWSPRAARESALVVAEANPWPRTIVLLGHRVAAAFLPFGAPTTPFTANLAGYVYLPHPSARCRQWNDPKNVQRARALLRSVKALAGEEKS